MFLLLHNVTYLSLLSISCPILNLIRVSTSILPLTTSSLHSQFWQISKMVYTQLGAMILSYPRALFLIYLVVVAAAAAGVVVHWSWGAMAWPAQNHLASPRQTAWSPCCNNKSCYLESGDPTTPWWALIGSVPGVEAEENLVEMRPGLEMAFPHADLEMT